MKALSLLLLTFSLFSCSSEPKFIEKRHIKIATTMSMEDKGFLDILFKKLEEERGIVVEINPLDFENTLNTAKNCTVDAVIMDSPTKEKKAIQDEDLKERIPFMVKNFILVGPIASSAIALDTDIIEILKDIKNKKSEKILFVSKGDTSTITIKEKELWKSVLGSEENITMQPWYMESGKGNLETLELANANNAFIFTDMLTWLDFKEKFPNTVLSPISLLDPFLGNTYSILFLSTNKCPKTKDLLARELASWLISKKTQEFIREYPVKEQSSFTPLYTEGLPK